MKWLGNRSTQQAAVKRKPRVDISLSGMTFIGMMAFMFLVAINSQANLLFAIAGLMLGIIVITIRINKSVLKRLIVSRSLPDYGVVGRPMPITYVIRNDKVYWPSLSVAMTEIDGVDAFVKQPHAYLLHCAARQTARVPAVLFPKRRGLYALHRLELSTSFPFGFVKRAASHSRKDTVLVYPPIAEVDSRLLRRFASAEVSGMSARPQRDGMDEFYGLKEYRVGENPRLIHWRRSARTGTLVSREMSRVSPPRLLVLVDTHLPSGAKVEEAAAVEKVIAMSASLADRALETGLSVGIVAWSNGWSVIGPNRGKRHRRDLLSLLACLPSNELHDRTELLSAAGDLGHFNATAVLISRHGERQGLDWSRGAPMLLSPSAEATAAYFRFPAGVDFSQAMPLGSGRARVRTGRRRRRKGRAVAMGKE